MNIDSADHVSRYCQPRTIDSGELQASAFLLRRDEPTLSVNWLEFIHPTDRVVQLTEVRAAFARKKYTLKASGRFAILNVGNAIAAVHEGTYGRHQLMAKHAPEEDDGSHAELDGIADEAELIAELLLRVVFPPLFPGTA